MPYEMMNYKWYQQVLDVLATGSVYGNSGWYLVVLGQYKLVLLNIRWHRISINKVFMPIKESGDLVGCHQSLTHSLAHRQQNR